ncbi:cadherin-related family member 1-like [Physella acuta]|uniref:cadherin-related family member 1-like n=1 Tax=Physella acuta TaxID=109671 RepID=UPI0027DBA3D6|nr:cadherin-related family member 1-like [Physella acuta]
MIIKDFNDNAPTFLNLPYRTSLNENHPTGTSVFSVTAKDPDSGPGGSVVYSINTDQQEYSQTFSIDPNSGVITLLRPLDYETRSFYHFNVYAKDLGSPPCPGPNCNCNFPSDHCEADVVDLFFTVTDIEDTPPVFENLPYMGVVNENVQIGITVLTVKAVDGDRRVAVPNPVYYNISGDTGFSSKFLINSSTGDITVNGVLDVDQGEGLDRAGIYLFTVTLSLNDSKFYFVLLVVPQ